MTLRKIEGFEFMPTGLSAPNRQRIWNAKRYLFNYLGDNAVPNVATGRFDSGLAWQAPTPLNIFGNQINQVLPLDAAYTSGYVGIAVFRGNVTSDTVFPFVSFFNGGNAAAQVSVVMNPYGVIEVRRGSARTGTVLSRTLAGAYQDRRWWYLEIYGNISDTGGDLQVRVNTKIVLDLVSVNTQNVAGDNTFDSIAIGINQPLSNTTLDVRFDDFYFCDSAGSINNTFLGNCRVRSQFVTANSTPLDFSIGGTAPAATNWQSVNNRNLTDNQFVFSGTAGDIDLYQLQAIVNSPVVFGVQLSAAYRQDDATQRITRNVLKSGSTTVEGQDHYINQDFTYYSDLWELNPDTGIGFTAAEVNALLAGPKVEV